MRNDPRSAVYYYSDDRMAPQKSIVPLISPGFPRRGFSDFGLGASPLAGLIRRRPRGARQLSGRPADRRHFGPRASPQAPHRRGARACAGAIRRVPAGSPRRARARHNRSASCSGSGGRPRRSNSMTVFRARRGGTGSKYVTLRGGLRRAIPFLLVGQTVWGQLYMGENGPARMSIARETRISLRLRDFDRTSRQPDRAFLRRRVGSADPGSASASSIQTGA